MKRLTDYLKQENFDGQIGEYNVEIICNEFVLSLKRKFTKLLQL